MFNRAYNEDDKRILNRYISSATIAELSSITTSIVEDILSSPYTSSIREIEDSTRELELDRDLDLDLNRDEDLDRDRNRDLDLDLDRDLDLDLDRDRDIDLDREVPLDYRSLSYLDLAST